MAICKFCGVPFAWGQSDGKWVPLVPIGEEGDHDRTHQDENGLLRTEHRAICKLAGGPTVRVVRLAKKVSAKEVLPLVAKKPDETVGETLDRLRANKRIKRAARKSRSDTST